MTHPGARMLLAGCLACACAAPSAAGAPVLYSQPDYQSPVRAEPDDLLMLAGDGLSADDVVVYRAVLQTATSPADTAPTGSATEADSVAAHPAVVPAASSSASGIAPVVSASGAPYQLTIRLPDTLLAGQIYELWVRNAAGEWSNGVSINDPRPLWISPAQVYASAPMAGLPRVLKVIGRNMSGNKEQMLSIRLKGPKTYELPSNSPADAEGSPLDQYVTKRGLAQTLATGQYRLELRVGAAPWKLAPGVELQVLPDPPPKRRFLVSSAAYGGCRPNEERDATACVAKAIDAARLAGGGIVTFDAGTWRLSPGLLMVPANVDLSGSEAAATRIVQHGSDAAPANSAEFVLLGHNVVHDLTFADERRFDPKSSMQRVLQLGRRYSTDENPRAVPATVSHIIITRNVFDKTFGAIIDGGSPIDHLVVTYNRLGDYRIDLALGGNPFNVRSRFGLSDSIIAHNEFLPGSYMDLGIRQGVIASELGAAQRVDFSENLADGSSKEFLNSPDDPAGFRAAFFWHLHDSQEMLLISENTIYCSGDKDGDGEAISLDNNINSFALPESQGVIAATDYSVEVAGPLKREQNQREIDPAQYYVGHWLRIDAGPGIGQSRRIVSYQVGPGGNPVIFTVAPHWDVTPRSGVSRVSVGRTFFQTLIVANTIDQRKPRCLKSNRTRPKAGNISVWAQATDGVVDGNRQFDSDGIVFQEGYSPDDAACAACGAWTSIPSFLEIRGNLIEGEYQWESACSLSGIMGSYAAAPGGRTDPPLLDFAVSISHNRIVHADSLYGGAINFVPTWFRGPAGYAKPLVTGVIIAHNEISDVAGPAPKTECDYRQTGRVGIDLQGDRFVDATVLYKNSCTDVSTPLSDHGVHTRRICDGAIHSCECGS